MRYLALASDYDGTLATGGAMPSSTADALQRYREAGGLLILVTGRDVADLKNICPRLGLFHWVVAENGALLYEPCSGNETLLTAPADPAMIAALKSGGIDPLYIGRVVVATERHQSALVEQVLAACQMPVYMLLNKDSLMILPVGIDKAFGLRALSGQIGLDLNRTIGVGDAENDEPLLASCGTAAAVSNALPSLKQMADWVGTQPAGAGVVELIETVLLG